MGRETILIDRDEDNQFRYVVGEFGPSTKGDFGEMYRNIRASLTASRDRLPQTLYDINYGEKVELDEKQQEEMKHMVRRHNERALALLILHGNAPSELVDPEITEL